jgi:hypothetical protein
LADDDDGVVIPRALFFPESRTRSAFSSRRAALLSMADRLYLRRDHFLLHGFRLMGQVADKIITEASVSFSVLLG